MNNPRTEKYFLPYQAAWLADDSPVKIWEKSRRIGATYVQAYEDVRDVATGKVPAVWFSSADESAAREYILYCAMWAKVLNVAAEDLGEQVLNDDRDIKTFTIEMSKGRINALSSNPKAFRSKGGKVVLDEFGFHEKAAEMWKAAKPVVTWGFPLRILSTHNGKGCLYFNFINRIKNGKLNWSLHTTDIYKAVADGLFDKIKKRPTTEKERADWIKQLEEDCFDHDTFLQEYGCVAVDEATAFLTYDMIGAVERNDLLTDLENVQGDLFVGMDIARKKHLSIIWVLEKLGSAKYTRKVLALEKSKFRVQREALFEILNHKNFRRACIDATGLGMQLAEEAQDAFGKYRVEGITFTNKTKEEMAYPLRTQFEDRTTYIPADPEIREDLHSIRKITTGAGNVRLDTQKLAGGVSHADRFWALALANHADSSNSGPIRVTSRKRRKAVDTVVDYMSHKFNLNRF